MKKCPYCAELIQDEAIICRYCGKKLIPKVKKVPGKPKATTAPRRRKEESQSTRAGGSVVYGNVDIHNGQFAGRDLNYVQVNSTQQAFESIYHAIGARQDTPPADKAKLNGLVKDIETEVKQAKPNESNVTKILKDVQKMAPDILEVILATLANPAAGISLVAKKVMDKAAQAAKANPVESG